MKRGDYSAKRYLQFSLVIFSLLVLLTSAFAEPVDPSRAAAAARGWYELRFERDAEQQPVGLPPESFIAGELARPIIVKGTTIAYAFDVPEGGCIAIAADDELSPVLYYSLCNQLDVPAVPPAQAILEAFADTIRELRGGDEAESHPCDPLWETLLTQTGSNDPAPTTDSSALARIGPLLTTTWNQWAPYNDQCPSYFGQSCPTGCVATAMAQIMRYWKHPKVGTGMHCYDWIAGGITLCEDFGSTSYAWSSMPDVITPTSPQSHKLAVSTLCYHCGVATNMQYFPDGSAASLIDARIAFESFFDYAPTNYIWRDAYTFAQWCTGMYNQIVKGQPVLYSIELEAGGHAIVLDGHDPANLSGHFTTGWGGQDDGWYSLNYHSAVGAVINIKPNHSDPTIAYTPGSLTASCKEGGNAQTQSFELWNSGGSTLEYTISDNTSWLACTPTSGTSTGEHDSIQVNFTTDELAIGTYSATIKIEALGATNTPQSIEVSLTVNPPPPPAISHIPTSLNNTCQEGTVAPARNFEIWNSGGKTLFYSITTNVPWLDCDPVSGSSTGEHDTVRVSYATAALEAGIYSGGITITASDASNSPYAIPVSLTVIGQHSFNIRHVDWAVSTSGDGESWSAAFKTIQQGIDAASDGDTVVVSPGVYIENIHFHGKNITLRSIDPYDEAVVRNTIIDGNQAGSAVTFAGTEGETCLLSGFTIRNAAGPAESGVKGSNVVGSGGAPRTHATIENNLITGNSTLWNGGGITWCGGPVQNNTIKANSATNGGGLAFCTGTIRNNTIVENSATGQSGSGGGLAWCDGAIQQNTVAANSAAYRGGGLWQCNGPIRNNAINDNHAGESGGGLWGCNGSIQNSTVNRNSAGSSGGGLHGCVGSVSNCIFWGNTATSGAQLFESSAPTYSCIQNWTGGEGNTTDDPQFVDLAGSDYRLSPDSPCIDAGKNEQWMWDSCDLGGNPRIVYGRFSVTVDMGAHEYYDQSMLPAISVTPLSLSSSVLEGTNAPVQYFRVRNAGGGTLSYSVTDSVSWLTCSPASGTSAGEHDAIQVSYSTSSLAPDSYSATVTVTAPGAVNTPRTIPVNLAVMRAQPVISLSITSLDNACVEGASAPGQSFEAWNSGDGTLRYSISDDASWLSCSPASGTSTGEHDTIQVTYSTASLPHGTYSATITLSDPLATNTPQEIRAGLTVEEPPPAIARQPSSLNNVCEEGTNAPGQNFKVWNAGGGTLSYSIQADATWLNCTPNEGTSTGEQDVILVTFDTSDLPVGAHAATITISAGGVSNSPQTVVVTLTVEEQSPSVIALGTTFLTTTCEEGQDAVNQRFEIWNAGGGTLDYILDDDGEWLSCIPDSGTSIGERDSIVVEYATAGLQADSYVATITVTASEATNSPQTLTVNLTVTPSSSTDIHYVDGSVASSGDGTSWRTAFKTIQQGIDAASEGDTVLVSPGVYVENIYFRGKNIILRSTDPLDPVMVANTVIDGNHAGSVVTFSGTEGETCLLSGFTIRNGAGLAESGVKGSSVVGSGDAPRTHATIENNLITGNSTWWHGGGITWCGGTIQNNIIKGNSAVSQYSCGGGLAWCNGTMRNNIIVGNSATGQNGCGGGLAWCDGTMQQNTISVNRAAYRGGGLWQCNGPIRNNVITDNSAGESGGGLWRCNGPIQNNTVTRNSAGLSGGGLQECVGSIDNCILWENTAPSGAQLSESAAPTYCCIQDWSGGGEGNCSGDPLFIDPNGPDGAPLSYEDNDYQLAGGSPCVDGGKNEHWMYGALDRAGNPRVFYGNSSFTVDIGAFEYGSFAFKIIQTSKTVDQKAVLSWSSRPGDLYTIWASSDLVSGNWFQETTVSSGGATTSWTDPATAGRVKFYRVEMKPQ